jgi:hypothetical protein
MCYIFIRNFKERGRPMKKTALVLVAAAMVFGGVSYASILPPLSPQPVAGETALIDSFAAGNPTIGYVDWIVLNPADYTDTAFEGLVTDVSGGAVLSQYLYLYQVESMLNGANFFTVDAAAAYVSAAGANAGDLDAVHNAGVFANLAGENEVAAGLVFPNLWNTDPDNTTWVFIVPPVDSGKESDVLWITSDWAPVYNRGNLQDGQNGSGMVPVPKPAVPDAGSTVMLLGFAVTGLGLLARRLA